LQKRAFQANKIDLQKRYFTASNVNGFPVELRQVFLNLISNAVQAMPQGGVLRLHVSDGIDWPTGQRGPVISVIDTGLGIKPEDAHRLFEPFFSTKAAKGTGLGLWISKGILQKYSGRISYRSIRREGQSMTCFRVFLPGNGTLSVLPEKPGELVEPGSGPNGGETGWHASQERRRALSATL
jgi:signal transduction histidine kinase